MPTRSLVIGMLAIGACLAWNATADAQSHRQQRLLRWLGHGYGDGYQHCDPGYRSDYYSPYSVHNTMRVSETREFDELSYVRNYAIQQGQPLHFFQGVPFSVYAAPQDSNWIAPGEPEPPVKVDNYFENGDPASAPDLPQPERPRPEQDHETAAVIPILNGSGRLEGVDANRSRMRSAGFQRRGN